MKLAAEGVQTSAAVIRPSLDIYEWLDAGDRDRAGADHDLIFATALQDADDVLTAHHAVGDPWFRGAFIAGGLLGEVPRDRLRHGPAEPLLAVLPCEATNDLDDIGELRVRQPLRVVHDRLAARPRIGKHLRPFRCEPRCGRRVVAVQLAGKPPVRVGVEAGLVGQQGFDPVIVLVKPDRALEVASCFADLQLGSRATRPLVRYCFGSFRVLGIVSGSVTPSR